MPGVFRPSTEAVQPAILKHAYEHLFKWDPSRATAQLDDTTMQYLTGLAIFALIVITVLYDRSRKLRPHPPGPRGFPIIGNFLDIPAKWEWQTYRKWGQDYGIFKPLVT